MATHYKWSIAEMENMTPWEFDVYVEMTRQHVEKKNSKS